MTKLTKIILTALAAVLAIGGLLFVLGMPSGSVELKPTVPKTATTVDQGQIGGSEVDTGGGAPASGHNAP